MAVVELVFVHFNGLGSFRLVAFNLHNEILKVEHTVCIIKRRRGFIYLKGICFVVNSKGILYHLGIYLLEIYLLEIYLLDSLLR